MKLVEPFADILKTYAISYNKAISLVETAARNCYQSEPKSEFGTLVKACIKNGHHSILEHVVIPARIVMSRLAANQFTRHRIGIAISQESTRYVNYSKEKFGSEIKVCRPYWFNSSDWINYLHYEKNHNGCDVPEDFYDMFCKIKEWCKSVNQSQESYMRLQSSTFSLPAEAARGVLPLDLKTEIIATCNIREWRNIFSLRVFNKCGKSHPDIKHVLWILYNEMLHEYPIFFEDLAQS